MDDTTAVVVRRSPLATPFEGDALTNALRQVIRGAILKITHEELAAMLGVGAYERSAKRRGYRNGSRPRTLSTSMGMADFLMPRGTLFRDGGRVEWKSAMVPRYARRAREVDAALLGLYFGGVNSRKVQRALRPLLANSPLSRSSVSRLVVRLTDYFEGWQKRSLAGEDIQYLYLDGTYMKVRCGGRSGSLPILAAVGVRSTGEKVLLALAVRGSESAVAWESFLEDLVGRGLKKPALAIVDGSQGLSGAINRLWPGMPRQRCTVHKLRNLLGHAPKRLHEEIRADYHAIVYAEEKAAARAAYDAFLRKWRRQSEGVARSLEEAGPELLAFTRFPKRLWRALRTTNIIERLNMEFRRRTKTQGMFPNERSVLVLLFGLVASGMVKLRKIDGWEAMGEETAAGEVAADQALAIS